MVWSGCRDHAHLSSCVCHPSSASPVDGRMASIPNGPGTHSASSARSGSSSTTAPSDKLPPRSPPPPPALAARTSVLSTTAVHAPPAVMEVDEQADSDDDAVPTTTRFSAAEDGDDGDDGDDGLLFPAGPPVLAVHSRYSTLSTQSLDATGKVGPTTPATPGRPPPLVAASSDSGWEGDASAFTTPARAPTPPGGFISGSDTEASMQPASASLFGRAASSSGRHGGSLAHPGTGLSVLTAPSVTTTGRGFFFGVPLLLQMRLPAFEATVSSVVLYPVALSLPL